MAVPDPGILGGPEDGVEQVHGRTAEDTEDQHDYLVKGGSAVDTVTAAITPVLNTHLYAENPGLPPGIQAEL